jgi:uncharacterized BrkB/YihY/UPF0761 family membrane protein
MSGGPLSPPPDGPFAGMTIGLQLLMGLGILLLLPGGCALFFIVALLNEKGLKAFSDPYVQFFVPVMIVSLLISVGGVWIVRVARRKARRPKP